MGKITETRKLYKETLKELTKTEENWLSFLDSSSWIFKREKIDIKEFSYIKEFNNDNVITILGQAVSDIAELGLREIAKTIKNLQIEEKIKIAHLLKIKIWIMLMIKNIMNSL